MIRAIPHCCAVLAVAALTVTAPATADAPAALHVSATNELHEGQRVTVAGSGFQPGLAAVAVGLCKLGFTNGLKDCDLEGGATFVNIGSDGGFGTLTLIVRPKFNGIDCVQQQCVIAAAPLPGTEPVAVITANSAAVPVSFAGSRLPAVTPVATPTTTTAATDTNGPSTLLWSATAGLLVIVAGMAFADRRRL
ncbi:neocarzinostatin apoprotein domain-containing protein [Nocardia sp. NBC_01503]|uniref:GPS-CTERM domain-containing protein n=1 Tax=Nocardia sp. NBC_01503 TaxID=2975997 RepID=UPI002E7BCDDB|nr:GPS-CTERM domain-containing protein [Nocardia sp. NBC_01503]WTL30893.1 neocarzinostatin apoprotein domain-containing protein [Nocardia sp. NBC_01503]